MRFTKMQGIGNDYIYVDTLREQVYDPAALAVAMSRPHFGVEADGLVLIGPSSCADFSMRIFNADGSESEMCGNACRCIGKYVYERGLTNRDHLRLETGAGVRELSLRVTDGHVCSVRVDMGKPELHPALIPAAFDGDTAIGVPLTAGGQQVKVTCLSMGNPHAVTFVENAGTAPVTRLGPLIECHPAFPRRTNVEFVQVLTREHLRLRVWERGSGETLACGTGACAALVAGVLNGLCERQVQAELPGGTLTLTWDPDGTVTQEGPAAFVFDGDWPGQTA